MPVVAGEAATHLQMLVYALLLIPASIVLVLVDERLGWFSMLALTALSVIFAYKCYDLKSAANAADEVRVKKAWGVFGFSLLYLALFFVVLVIDGAFI